jgi:hypothetical protein
MSAAPFLALLAIAMLPLTVLRLELNFRRTARVPSPSPARPKAELRIGPAGGY